MSLKVLILAGGSGTRLWPLSRKYYPKQFLKLKEFGNISFFERTFNRALKITSKENIYVLTNKDYKFHCMNQCHIEEENIILEPLAKNTLGAITLGIEHGNDDDMYLVLPSDSLINEEDVFAEIVNKSREAARKSIVIFGVKPSKPHTGYGYINFKKEGNFPYEVLSFKEKPDEKTAIEYIQSGYYWNAGMFLFTKTLFLKELENHNPEYFALIKDGVLKNFTSLGDVSIDYGLLEKSNNIKMSPLDIYWNDLGGFDSFDEYFTENNIVSPCFQYEAKNNLIIEEIDKKEVALIGVDNIIVIDTKDALLITRKGETQNVKHIVQQLKSQNKSQGDYGMTIYRPWGSYTIIDEGVGFKTKRLSVSVGKKLSSQLHHHRSEHWVVVSGTAKVSLNDTEQIVAKGESVYIPIGTKHRLENCGKTELHIIESQIGDYLEEDDIVRFDDDYGRV